MNRRSFIKNTSLSASVLTLSPKQILSTLLQQPSYKLTSLRGNIGYFNERGGTIAYYISNNEIVIVDTQFEDTILHLLSELTNKYHLPFKLLINTHHHIDHTSGNIAFKGLAEHVVGHENCLANYKRVSAAQHNEDKQLFQDTTFTTTWQTKVGHENIKAHYFGAAHTNGDAVIHFEHANIAHVGDLMFNKIYPYIDMSAGASFKSWVQVLDKVLTTFDNKTTFIFGHASKDEVIGNKEDLKKMRHYIEQLLTLVEKEIKSGKTKDEIMKITSIPDVCVWTDEKNVLKMNLDAAYTELNLKI
jgi:glyoxylase-like metal-dependent hydrolase (beta-lactamase superfamily II)